VRRAMSCQAAIVRRRPLVRCAASAGCAALAVAATLAVAYLALVGLGGGALAYMLPPLLLLAVLVLCRYPGERTLLALMRPRRRTRLRADARALAPGRRPRAMTPRGGDLLACSLAVRPPPRLAVVSHS
jgi:hypothetical protein